MVFVGPFDGASGGDLVQFFLYLGLDVSALSPVDRLEAFEDVMATHPNLVEYEQNVL